MCIRDRLGINSGASHPFFRGRRRHSDAGRSYDTRSFRKGAAVHRAHHGRGIPGGISHCSTLSDAIAIVLRLAAVFAIYATLMQLGINRAVRATLIATQAADTVGMLKIFQAMP